MAFEQLKQRQATAWGAAPFERIAKDIQNVHEQLVRELEPQAGERWLDIGTGTGGVAALAARAGAEAEEGLDITYDVGDVTNFGPMKTLHDSLDDEQKEELHRVYVEYYEKDRGNDCIESPREYLTILGRRK